MPKNTPQIMRNEPTSSAGVIISPNINMAKVEAIRGSIYWNKSAFITDVFARPHSNRKYAEIEDKRVINISPNTPRVVTFPIQAEF